MAAVTSVLATITASLGYGVYNIAPGSVDSTIFEGREPDAPYQCITIYQPGAAADTLDFSGNTNGEQSAQFRFRDIDQASLQARILGLYGVWAAWKRYPTYYTTVRAATKPLFTYPTQPSNQGDLWIASFNVRVIQSS